MGVGHARDRSGREVGSPESSERIELSGRVRTAKACIEWHAKAIAGRWQAVIPNTALPDRGWSSVGAESWDEEDNVTYAIEIVTGDRFLSQGPVALPGRAYIWRNVPPVAVCQDGLIVDLPARTGGMGIRVLGIVSGSRSPELWEDDETPTIDGFGRRVSFYTPDFWLGVFAD